MSRKYTWFGAKRAYKLMKSRDWCGARSLSFPLNWNAWMNESMNEGHQRNSYNTAHELNWALALALSFFFFFITRSASVEGSASHCIVFVCDKPTTIIICSGHTSTHIHSYCWTEETQRHTYTHIRVLVLVWDLCHWQQPKGTQKKKKRWVRKPMEQPATST